VRHTLVIHPGALGDVLLAVPALRGLRATRPGSSLVLAAQPRLAALLVALAVVDGGVGFDALGLHTLMAEEGPAEVVPLVREAEAIVCWFGARDPIFVRRLREILPAATVAAPAPGEGGTVWAHLLATVGAPPGEHRAPVAAPEPVVDAGRRALLAAGWDGRRPVLIVHPGAGGQGKRWPPDGFARLLSPVVVAGAVTVVVHQGPADADAVGALVERLPRPPLVLIDPPLPDLAGALIHARAFLGNDSGVAHLAAGLGIPSVVLFAAPNLPWTPWSRTTRCLVVTPGRLLPQDAATVAPALAALLARANTA
jgi:heptosyltransferase III